MLVYIFFVLISFMISFWKGYPYNELYCHKITTIFRRIANLSVYKRF